MRILVVSNIYLPQKEGGAERVARRTAETLTAAGHQVAVLAVSDLNNDPAADLDTVIPVFRVPYVKGDLPNIGPMQKNPVSKLIWHLRNGQGGVDATKLTEVLDSFKPDVIYAHNSRLLEPDLSRLANARAIPLVQHLHDYGWMCPRNSMFRKGRSCSKPCLNCTALTSAWRKVARPTDVIAVSEFVQDKYQSNGVFPGARWHVLRNTVSVPKTVTAPQKINTFGFIGALAPDKGIEDLVRAFAMATSGNWKLRVAGAGAEGYVRQLQQLSTDLGVADHITWLGQVDKADFFQSVDCVVVPSRWDEPQSLVLGEGLAYKRPLIVSDRGGSTEVLTATQSGLIFDPDRLDSLVSALVTMAGKHPSDFSYDLTGVLPKEIDFTNSIERILFNAVHQ